MVATQARRALLGEMMMRRRRCKERGKKGRCVGDDRHEGFGLGAIGKSEKRASSA